MGETRSDTKDHGAWRTKLQHYVDAGDRADAREPCFVGRDGLFDLVGDMVGSCERNPGSRTVVVSGAPGAGKSAFIAELHERALEDRTAFPVRIKPQQMTPIGLFRTIMGVAGVSPEPEREVVRKRSGKVRVPLLSGERASELRQHILSDESWIEKSDDVPWGKISERLGDALGGKPILLLCDEAQTLNADNAKVRAVVTSLHYGDDTGPVRIVPVFAGLSDTRAALRKCGITRVRLGNAEAIGALPPGTAKAYALKTLRYFETDSSTGATNSLSDWIVKHGDGWPKHLRVQMFAIAKEMLDKDDARVIALNPSAVVSTIVEERNTFYEERLEATGHPRFVRSFARLARLAHTGDGAVYDDLLVEASRMVKGAYKPPDADQFVDAAVHAGILQHVSPTRLKCPIPSMLTWLETGNIDVDPPPFAVA